MPDNSDANSNKGGKKKRSKVSTILMIILDIVIITAAFGAVFYFIFYNNIGGVTEKYYSTVKSIPLLNLALPEAPDALNPKYMTQDEIRKKYIEFKAENEQLKKQLSDAEKKAGELQVYKDDTDKLTQEAQTKLQSLETREATIAEKEKQLEEQKSKLDEIIAMGDKEAYKQYYESIDAENAEVLYQAVIKEQQTDENIKKFAQVYAEMDPAAAAAIFEQLGTSKLDMITETLKAMNKVNSSKILEAMPSDFAAKVTDKLNTLYKGD